jgi:hypothetical protein
MLPPVWHTESRNLKRGAAKTTLFAAGFDRVMQLAPRRRAGANRIRGAAKTTLFAAGFDRVVQ